MTGALLSFAAIAVAIRELARTFNLFEVLAVRSGFGLLVLGTLVLVRPDLRRLITSQHLALHAVRNVTHFVGQYAWAWGLTLLPLATVFALEFTMPLWVTLLAVPLLGERLTPS